MVLVKGKETAWRVEDGYLLRWRWRKKMIGRPQDLREPWDLELLEMGEEEEVDRLEKGRRWNEMKKRGMVLDLQRWFMGFTKKGISLR